jgi:lipopolysaccharide transport system permease protein
MVPKETVIEPRKGLFNIKFRELRDYRDLLYFFAQRDIKVRYKQTILGGLWAVIQPFFTMVVFTVFFGKLAKVPSDGVPYPIFVYAGLLPWTYFANAISSAGNSVVGNASLVTKVYFPRVMIPIAACLAGLIDFAIALCVYFLMMVYYHVPATALMLLLPVLIVLMLMCATGVGLWLASLNVRYRDIRYVIPFLVQVWLFVSPVIYPTNFVGKKYQWLMALNPMGGLITAFRASLLGQQDIDWPICLLSAASALLIFVSGLYYFGRTEETFADDI